MARVGLGGAAYVLISFPVCLRQQTPFAVCAEIEFRSARAHTPLRSRRQKDGRTKALCHPDRRLPEWRDRGASARRNRSSLKQHRLLFFPRMVGHEGEPSAQACGIAGRAPQTTHDPSTSVAMTEGWPDQGIVSSRPEAAGAEGSRRLRAPQPQLSQAAPGLPLSRAPGV